MVYISAHLNGPTSHIIACSGEIGMHLRLDVRLQKRLSVFRAKHDVGILAY